MFEEDRRGTLRLFRKRNPVGAGGPAEEVQPGGGVQVDGGGLEDLQGKLWRLSKVQGGHHQHRVRVQQRCKQAEGKGESSCRER